MPRKKAKEVEASIEETLEEKVPEEVEEAPVEEEALKAEAPVTVPVSSLADGAEFEYGGKLYQKQESTATFVSAYNPKTERYKAFPSDTLVIPR